MLRKHKQISEEKTKIIEQLQNRIARIKQIYLQKAKAFVGIIKDTIDFYEKQYNADTVIPIIRIKLNI